MKVVLDNIKSTASGDTKLTELSGSDEIDALNARIIDSARQIRKAQKDQAQTVRLIAEELELPLKYIAKSYANLMASGFVDLSERGAERINKAIEETSRLEALVEELSRTTEVSAANLELNVTRFDLSELGRSSVSVVEEFARQRNIEIICELSPVFVYGDFDRVKQVAINLLSNAIKFSPDCGKILVETRPDSSGGRLSVKDEGPGIPDEFKNRVFRRFEQSGAKAENDAAGTGLGLAISKELMNAQHGQLQFESPIRDGKGTEFWLCLPVQNEAAKVESAGKGRSGDVEQTGFSQSGFSGRRPFKRTPLWIKGAFALSIPLVLYLIMSGMLLFTFHSMQKSMGELSMAREIGSLSSQTIDASAEGWNLALLYNVTQDPECMKGVRDADRRAQALVNRLQAIASKDVDLADSLKELSGFFSKNVMFQNEILSAKRDMLANQFFGSASVKNEEALLSRMQGTLFQVMERENAKVVKKSTRLVEIHRWTEIILLFFGIAILSVSLVLGGLLVVRWTKRIKPILENVANLSRGEAPANLLYGEDELAKIDAALHEAAAKMAELKQFKNELMSVTSHELRTPLTSMAALTEMIEAGIFGSLTKDGRIFLAQAEHQIADLIFTITNLLDLEKMLSGKVLVQKNLVLVSDVLEKVKANSERVAGEREIQVECAAASANVPADDRRLVQSLTALVRHYIDVVPEQSTIRVYFKRSGDHADFVVAVPRPGSDTGFELFRSHHAARQHLVEELSRIIAVQHGGALSIYDEGDQRFHEVRLSVLSS